MLEEKIDALIVALEQNTTAILSSSPNKFPNSSAAEETKQETAKQKKAKQGNE